MDSDAFLDVDASFSDYILPGEPPDPLEQKPNFDQLKVKEEQWPVLEATVDPTIAGEPLDPLEQKPDLDQLKVKEEQTIPEDALPPTGTLGSDREVYRNSSQHVMHVDINVQQAADTGDRRDTANDANPGPSAEKMDVDAESPRTADTPLTTGGIAGGRGTDNGSIEPDGSKCFWDEFESAKDKAEHQFIGRREFINKNARRNVVAAHDKKHKQKISCGVREKSFNSKPCLQSHQGTHVSDKPYKCVECGKTFGRRYHLNVHVSTHTGDKPHKCDVCGKAFTQRGHLTRHMLIHACVKLHRCDQCGKAFALRSTLTRHMLTHTGDKHHKCDECGKAFSHRGNFNRHVLTHTGDKPRCDECGNTFSQRYNLTKHMLVHARRKPYKCDACEKVFSLRWILDLHLLTHIGDKPHKYDQ